MNSADSGGSLAFSSGLSFSSLRPQTRRTLYAGHRLKLATPPPATDVDLEELFGSGTMRRSNLGLSRLCNLIEDDSEHVLLPRIGEILWDGGVLEAHRTLLDHLVELSERPAAETAARSIFGGPFAATPAVVVGHMVSVQREVLRRMEELGRRSRDRCQVAYEAQSAYHALVGMFNDSRYSMNTFRPGQAAEQHRSLAAFLNERDSG